jgi:hypothetical protein
MVTLVENPFFQLAHFRLHVIFYYIFYYIFLILKIIIWDYQVNLTFYSFGGQLKVNLNQGDDN